MDEETINQQLLCTPFIHISTFSGSEKLKKEPEAEEPLTLQERTVVRGGWQLSALPTPHSGPAIITLHTLTGPLVWFSFCYGKLGATAVDLRRGWRREV